MSLSSPSFAGAFSLSPQKTHRKRKYSAFVGSQPSHSNDTELVSLAENLLENDALRRDETDSMDSNATHEDVAFQLSGHLDSTPASRHHSPFHRLRSSIYAALLSVKRFIPLSPRISPSADKSTSLSATLKIIIRYDAKLRATNMLLSFFAFLGIILMMVTHFINFTWWLPHHALRLHFYVWGNHHVPQEEVRVLGPVTHNVLSLVYHTLSFVNFFNTGIILIVLVLYYHILSMKRRDEIGLATKLGAFFYGNLWQPFLLEFVCLMWCPPPLMNALLEYSPIKLPLGIDELSLLMFLRLYLIMRLVRDFSPVYRKRHKIIASNPSLRETSSQFGWVLTLRLLLFTKTFSVLIPTCIFTTTILTFCLWISDREYNASLSDPREVLYFTMQTMCTIGYGTSSPSQRFASRCFAIGASLCGVIIIAFFSAVVVDRLRPSEYHEAIARFTYREKYIHKRLTEAVRILQLQYLYRKGKCGQAYWFENLRRSIKKLRHYKRKIVQFADNASNNAVVRNLDFSGVVMKRKMDDLGIILEELKVRLNGNRDL